MTEDHLRSSHVSCLYYIYALDTATSTDLCERCEEDKATISRALDFLEANGYIIRDVDSARRYKSPIVLTDKGRKTGKKISERIEGILNAIRDSLTEEERTDFYRCLSIVSNSLDTLTNNNTPKE